MFLIKRILRWILSVIITVIILFCILYALGLFNQTDIGAIFKNIKILFI
ncbi:MAG: hypothetical protein II038_14105 [Lachnospiraceae bacterium]|nr:hypothetical protein [Lachnospiraceae bacterium]